MRSFTSNLLPNGLGESHLYIAGLRLLRAFSGGLGVFQPSIFSIKWQNCNAVSGADDGFWQRFYSWLLDAGLSVEYAQSVLRYSRQYAWLLECGRLSELRGMSCGKRRNVLCALANLAKFMGFHSWFVSAVKEAGLSWRNEGAEWAFEKLWNGEILGLESWLHEVKQMEREVWFPVKFMYLSGLRPREAFLCLNKIAVNGLSGYLNRDLGVLEHFRDKRFMRRSKKAFVTVLTENMKRDFSEWRESTTYWKLRKRFLKRGLSLRFYELRKNWSTEMWKNGIAPEMIDLFQGRLPSTIFVRHYLRPNIKEEIAKVRSVLEKMEKYWETL